MRTWTAQHWWVWYLRVSQAVAVVGGVIMLLAAAIIHQAPVVPFAVIGGLWLFFAFVGVGQTRGMAWNVSINGDQVAFGGRREDVMVPATGIIEIRRRRGDFYHLMPIRVQTRTHGTVLLPPRVKGMVELLVELRRLNPSLTIGPNL